MQPLKVVETSQDPKRPGINNLVIPTGAQRSGGTRCSTAFAGAKQLLEYATAQVVKTSQDPNRPGINNLVIPTGAQRSGGTRCSTAFAGAKQLLEYATAEGC